MHPRARALQQGKPPQLEACALQLESSLHLPQLKKSLHSNDIWHFDYYFELQWYFSDILNFSLMTSYEFAMFMIILIFAKHYEMHAISI